MTRKAKYTPEQKIQACEDYLSGKKSATQIARELNMSEYGDSKVIYWAKQYKANGPSIFEIKSKNSSYSREFKIMVAKEYVEKSASSEQLASKYSIPTTSTVLAWVKKYNNHIELKDYDPKPEVYMANSRKTTIEEREEIVKWCLDHNNNYKEAAFTFNCSYSQVHNWVKKYEELGLDGLKDKRGVRKKESSLSELELANKRIELLERKLELAKRREELLKKAEKLERM